MVTVNGKLSQEKSLENGFYGFEYYLSQGIHCVKRDPITGQRWEKYREGDWKPRTLEQAISDDRALAEGRLGIEVMCGPRSGIIALDVETYDLDVLALLPRSQCVKIGKRGETRFFLYSGESTERFLNDAGDLLFEILSSPFHLCNIPPSLHHSDKELRLRWQGSPLCKELLTPFLTETLEELRARWGNKVATAPEFASGAECLELVGLEREIEMQKVLAALEVVDAGLPYPEWRDIAYALRNSFGVRWSRAKFCEWSAKNAQYICPETADLIADFFRVESRGYRTYNGRKIGLGTLYGIASRYGFQVGREGSMAILGEMEKFHVEHSVEHVGNGNGVVKQEGPAKEINFRDHPYQVAEAFRLSTNGVIYCKRRWWDYEKSGITACWKRSEDSAFVEKAIHRFIIAENYHWLPEKDGDGNITKRPCINVRMKQLAEIRGHLQNQCSVRQPPISNQWLSSEMQAARPDILPLRNGLLDVRTLELLSYTPDFFNEGVLPITYTPGAACPRWQEAMGMYFAAEPWVKDALQLWFGYVLLSSKNLKKIGCFVGDSGAGKSTIVKLLNELVGADLMVTMSGSSLNGDFTPEGLDKARLIFLDEFPLSTLTKAQVDKLKGLTSGAPMHMNSKNLSEYSTVITGKVCITSNTEPVRFEDPKGALLKRLVFFQCSPLPSEIPHVTNYEKQLLKEEGSGILNWALEGAKRVLAGEDIPQPRGKGETYRQAFKDAGGSSFERFCSDMLVYDDVSNTSIKSLFDSFRLFCKESGLGFTPSTISVFGRSLSTRALEFAHLGKASFGKNRLGQSVMKGVRLRTVDEDFEVST